MKYVILLTLLLSGCVNTYSKQEVDSKIENLAKVSNLQDNQLAAWIWRDKISECKKKNLGFDYSTTECKASK